MHSKLGVFSVFLFATILLIPASSFPFANAQEYYNDKKDTYPLKNNKADYIAEDGKQ